MSALQGFMLVIASALMFSSNAKAAPIAGELGFIGWGYSLVGGTNFANSTGLNFATGTEYVVGGTGDYASVPDFTLATFINGLTFNPFPVIPQAPLWSFAANGRVYSFDLSALTVESKTATELVLRGEGTLNITGFDTTNGTWNFTGNTLGTVFTFSSGAHAPEIDAASGTSAIALLTGVLLWMGEKKRLRSQRSSKSDK